MNDDFVLLNLDLCPKAVVEPPTPIQPIVSDLCLPKKIEPLVKPLEKKQVTKNTLDNNAKKMIDDYTNKSCVRFDYKTAIDRFNENDYNQSMLNDLINYDISIIEGVEDE